MTQVRIQTLGFWREKIPFNSQLPSHCRSSDYKPVPPPKSSNYKPVPPPKPKNYKPQAPGGMGPGLDGGGGGWGDIYTDGRKVYERGTYHTTSNGGLSDDYSGLDSGQGSSLDRKYDTFGRSSYSKVKTRFVYHHHHRQTTLTAPTLFCLKQNIVNICSVSVLTLNNKWWTLNL